MRKPRKDCTIYLRMTTEEKAHYMALGEAVGLDLSDVIRQALRTWEAQNQWQISQHSAVMAAIRREQQTTGGEQP